MTGLSKAFSGLFEQTSYSVGRFLFWISAPAMATEAWDKIAVLSLMNLFMMTLYGSIIGGPSFIRLLQKSAVDPLYGYFPCHAMIAALALIGPLLYVIIQTEDARDDPGFILLLILLPWVSSAADWSRKTMILLNRQGTQFIRNFAFSALWLIYVLALLAGIFPINFEILSLIFCLLTGVIYLPVRGSFQKFNWVGHDSLAPFSVWRHYLFTGLVAYMLGNAVFWINSDSDVLQQFVIMRNYLTPVLLLSLYIESYGAVQLEAATQKRRLIGGYLLGVLVATIILASAALVILYFSNPAESTIDLSVFGLVVITTFLIAVIKVPTVYLRLRLRDHLVSAAYLTLFPIWPLAYLLNFLPTLPYLGLELLVAQYLLLAIGLSIFAAISKNPSRER